MHVRVPASHWVLDLIVHAPDLPVLPTDAPKVGLGLWGSPIGTAIVEGSIFIAGLVLYLRATRARNATGKWSLWLLVILLVINQIAGRYSPMPANQHALGWAGYTNGYLSFPDIGSTVTVLLQTDHLGDIGLPNQRDRA